MADDTRDEKEERKEVFNDILKSQQKLYESFYDMVIRHCDEMIKLLGD